MSQVYGNLEGPNGGPRAASRTSGVAGPAASCHRVAIGGRAFTLDAVYAARRQASCPSEAPLRPRRLLGYDPAYPWPGGRVEAEVVLSEAAAGPSTRRQWLSGRAWLPPVDAGSGLAGRGVPRWGGRGSPAVSLRGRDRPAATAGPFPPGFHVHVARP